MSAYTTRSLYEDNEEDEGTPDVDLPVTHQAGEVFNDSPTQAIIIAIYGSSDTLQVAHIEKKKIPPASSTILTSLQSSIHPLTEYNMHIHFPGLMGMISPRTQQSSGYGFKVQSGESYHVSLLTKKDSKGNKCAVFRANSIGPEVPLDSTVYKFGDMLLKPSLRLAKRVFKLNNLNLKPALYTEYRLRRKNKIEYTGQGDISHVGGARGASGITSSSSRSESQPLHSTRTLDDIDELEIWGLFFDDICTIGVSLCQNTFHITGLESDANGSTYGSGKDTCSNIKKDESDKERGEEEKKSWISVDDIDLQEPFLFIGLPACALFMTIFRSFTDRDGIVLMDARRIVRETCPESYKEMFEMLMVTKSSLMDIELNESGEEDLNNKLQQNDLLWMQQFLLYSSSDQEMTITPECGGPSVERQTQFRHALSHLVGVCIQLTQQPYFKENFLSVLEEISNRVSD